MVDVAIKMLQPVHPGTDAYLSLMQQYQVDLLLHKVFCHHGPKEGPRVEHTLKGEN